MKSRSADRLKQDIVRLRRLVARYPTGALARMLAVVLQKSSADAAATYQLSSPYRQIFYLLGLMLTTPEPRGPAANQREMTREDLRRCCELLESIFHYYASMYHPTASEVASGVHMTEEWRRPRDVAMPAFLNYFNAARLMAGVEQMIERIRGLCIPFDDVLHAQIGLSATDALRMSEWVSRQIQDTLDASMEAMKRVDALRTDLAARSEREAWDTDRYLQEMQSATTRDASLNLIARIDAAFIFRRDSLEATFGHDLASVYWNRFVARRDTIPEHKFTFPTDPNPADFQPLIEIQDGQALCAVGNSLYYAILLQTAEVFMAKDQDVALRNRYLANRDRFLEKQVIGELQPFFGPDAVLLPSVYETPKAAWEHDLVLIWQRQLLIIESKAGVHAPPFRDPDRAYKRLGQEFKDSVQKGYEQADRLRRIITEAATMSAVISLYDKHGNVLFTLNPATDVENIYCICVTTDNLGMLAVDLSLLLTKADDGVYPWCVNILDLQNFLTGLTYRGWGPGALLRYLEARSRLHGKIAVADELQIAGIFLTDGTLDALEAAAATVDSVSLTPDTAQIFDDIYRAVYQGGPPIDFSTVKPLRFASFNQIMEQAFIRALHIPDGDSQIEGIEDEESSLPRNASPTRGRLERVARRLIDEGVTSPRLDALRANPVPFHDLMSHVTATATVDSINTKTPGRNDSCPCGSGRKYKRCCGRH
jgi:hypothetical protein